MNLFPPPQIITPVIFAELPQGFRRSDAPAVRVAAGRGAPPGGCFLEGPSFDRAGNLYVTDIPYGRIFRISPKAEWELVIEYDGEPNGLKIHKDGRIFVADHKRGLLLLDAQRGTVTPLIERHNLQHFKGLNDLCFASNGDLYFTDQGQTGLQDASGCVYRLRANGRLEVIADNIPSPNGLVLNKAQNIVYVGVTRANAVWRLPLLPDGKVSRMGVFIQLSGGRGPDGMAIDEHDGLAVAHPDMGAVWIFNHRGEPLYRIQSPKSEVVTNCAYGGADRKTLYIVDSEGGFILTATLPTAGRAMFSHA
jgi:gluconolactonase